MSTRSQSKDTIYEDFQPKSEWVEDAVANVLTIHLPGFTKDQIKITYEEKPPRMTVRGDRPVRDSVVSRFSKEFPIPENCKLDEMKARLDHHEVLTITMPKKIITPEPAQPKDTVPTDEKPQQEAPSSPPSAAAADQTAEPPPEPQEEQIGSAPKGTAGAATSETGKEREEKTDEQTQKAPSPGFPEPKTQKGETPSQATRQKQADDQVARPFHPLEDTSRQKSQKIREETSPETSPVPDAQRPTYERGKAKQDQKPVDQKAEHQEKSVEEKDQPKSKETPSQVFDRIGKEAVELAATARRAVVGLEEERRLLVNAGVAVLVIVAFGAYVSYKLSSSGGSDPKSN